MKFSKWNESLCQFIKVEVITSVNFLTRFSLKNPAAIIIITLLVTLGGIFSAFGLKKETMPDINIPIVAVITPYPGASPNDILDDVTKPMENALMNVPGVESINSTSTENASAVIAQFSFSANMDDAKREIEDAIKTVKLPEGALETQINRISFGSFPILKLSISNDEIDSEKLGELVEDLVLKDISSTDGVGQAQLVSDSAKAVYIKLLPEQLKKHNLTSQQITQQLQAHNINFPVGSVTLDATVNPVKISGDIQSLEELKNLQIPIFPDPNEQMKKAFEEIGDGMATLGNAVGQLGTAVGQIGEGMAGVTQGLNGEIQLLSAIHDTESQLLAAKMTLAEVKSALKNPLTPEHERLTAQATAEQLSQQIQIGETALAQMKAKLKEVQSQISKAAQAPKKSAPKPEKKKAKNEEKPEIKLISLSELAEIEISATDASALSRINGNDSVVIDIIKSQEANTVDVTDAVKEKMENIENKLPEGTKVDILFDQSVMVKESVNSMLKEGILGAVFASIVILFFLRNVRSTVISVISIPLSILITLAFLKQLDITLNILTLGALAIAVGRVVDDSIVVIENVYRHLQKSQDKNVELIKVATKEVGNAITSSTLTTAAVFLPLGLVDGMIGIIFKPFAFTVVIALLASLFVAVTVVPMMAKFMLLKGQVKEEVHKEGKVLKGYKKLLQWTLNHKFVTLFLAVLLFVGSLGLIPLIGTSFMPTSEEKYISIDISYPVGTELQKTNEKVMEVEKLLEIDKNIIMYQTTVGSAQGSMSMMGGNSGTNEGNIFVQFEETVNLDNVIDDYKEKLTKIKGESSIDVMESSTEGDSGANSLEVVVTGVSKDKIKEGAKQITDELKEFKGLENVKNNVTESKPEILIDVNQEKASKLGLSAAQIGGTMRELLGTSNVGTIRVEKENLELKLGLKIDPINKINDIQELKFTSALGDKVLLKDIAEVSEVPGPVTIYTKNGEEYASVTATIKDKDTGAVTMAVQEKINELTLPKGVDVKIGGTIEQMNESFAQLGIAIAVAIGAVYLVMVITFGEARAPFAILFSLPLAAIGGFLGLYIAGIPLDMPAMIGFLMLIGIVVTNAIVLLDRVQHQRAEGVPVREALIEAGMVRLRPIIMTALATIGALSPLAIGISKGSLMSQSLAVVVIGGLTTSTLLTLVIVPVVFELLVGKRKKQK